jgi:S-adenosylmethionine/arginine decarboxylase-like enzyme
MKVTDLLTEAKTTYWGYHLILDCSQVNENVSDPKEIRKMIKALVKRIKMKAVGEPIIKFLKEGVPHLQGYSCLQLIETSSITMHLNDAPESSAYIDIFSCKDFKAEDAIAVVEEYFAPKKIKQKFLHRQA